MEKKKLGEKGKEGDGENPRAKILATALPTFKLVVPCHLYLPILFKQH